MYKVDLTVDCFVVCISDDAKSRRSKSSKSRTKVSEEKPAKLPGKCSMYWLSKSTYSYVGRLPAAL